MVLYRHHYRKMKLPITDQFLWDIYKSLDKSKDILGVIFNPYPRIGDFWAEKNPLFEKYRKDKNKLKFRKLIYHLKSRNYIKVASLQGKKAIVLTKKGLSKALKASFIVQGKEKRKDGRWIMLMFDVPEKWHKSRDLLRSVLHNLGYKLFQKSVWVTPYDVSEKTEELLQTYNLDEFVKIFIVEEV